MNNYDTYVRTQVWQCGNIADIAGALASANDDPMFQAGVIALARALNAEPRMPRQQPIIVQLIEAAT